MPSCTSCGAYIPEGQGKNCSMCYGDIDHGRDGYYRKAIEEEEERRAEEKRQEQQRQEEEQRGDGLCT